MRLFSTTVYTKDSILCWVADEQHFMDHYVKQYSMFFFYVSKTSVQFFGHYGDLNPSPSVVIT